MNWTIAASGRGILLAALQLAGMAVGRAAPALAEDRPIVLAQENAPKIFHATGVITSLDAGAGMLGIDHTELPGLEDAKVTHYAAKPAAILDGLKVGDTVEFGVEGMSMALLEIRKIGPAK